jgi:hypothetical protein
MCEIRGIGRSFATRLLALARPDGFVVVNKKSVAWLRQATGLKLAGKTRSYRQLLEWVAKQAWYQGPEPTDPQDRRLWTIRAALLDAFAYQPEQFGSERSNRESDEGMLLTERLADAFRYAHKAIAALLHDAAEDQGGAATLAKIKRRFGEGVAEIVSDCTDSWSEPKPEWRSRKEAYLAVLPQKPTRSLLVSLADKTHNAEAILCDYRALGDDLWERFNGGADGTRWYYSALVEVFSTSMPGPLVDRFARAVAGFSS